MTTDRRLKGRAVWLAAGLAILMIGLPAALAAQEGMGRGRMNGDVLDESGAPIEGVAIKAQKVDANAALEAKTDKKGHFAIAGMGTGVWRFTFTKDGYQTLSQDHEVKQLRTNEPLQIVLRKLSGLAALQTDKAGLEDFDKANALVQEEKYDEALAIFEGFLAKYPEVYQTRLNIAGIWARKGDLDKAEAEYKAVLAQALPADASAKKDNESAVRALSGLGELALKKGDFETARGHFTQALQISPQDPVAAYNVGEIFFSNQKNDEAVEYLEMAIRIKPGWSKPYYRLGLVCLNKGDYAKALEALNKFVELDPQNPEVPNVKNIIAAVEKMKK